MKRTVTVHECDRCGHQFSSPREMKMNLSISTPDNSTCGRKELCESCKTAFLSFMDQVRFERNLSHGVRCHLQQFDHVNDASHHHHTGSVDSKGSHSHTFNCGATTSPESDTVSQRITQSSTTTAITAAII